VIVSAKMLLGKSVQDAILAEVMEGTRAFVDAGHRAPQLAAVLAGDDPASAIYVRTKTRKCAEIGFESQTITLPDSTTTADLLDVVERLNADDAVDGILVQLPVPDGCDSTAVLDAIDPRKDVDGFHAMSAGLLMQGRPRFVPATPAGIIQMLERDGIEISGKNAVVIGRSDIVGKPMAMLLLHRHATVTLCHSRTDDLPAVARRADILVAAVGRPCMVTPDFVKPGATVIDVGINRVSDRDWIDRTLGELADRDKFEEKGYLVVGDVHPAVAEVAGAMTPVPGGVGPLTIAMLMYNTLLAAQQRRGEG
jgi:methylenetetrahydrofolate dehydrogenase (NADP+)/methenyltetrahydrofolate cyclohydrolase